MGVIFHGIRTSQACLGGEAQRTGQRLETGITGVGMGRKRAGQGIRKGVVKFF